jgi:lipid-binding SYLF domain-containing protein
VSHRRTLHRTLECVPSLFALEGGNIGFQLGGQATDFVLLVMNPKGANSILGSKVKLGADASAAAGPKGRDAAADMDIVMKAEVLGYSRSRGFSPESLSKGLRFGRMAVQTRNSMGVS